MLKIIVDAWERAQNWRVGRYVIMPDHIHFFCAPMSYPASDFHKWMKYWKRLTQQAFAARGDTRPPVYAARGDTRPPVVKLWQNGCWDTQMRTRDQYEGKWLYVRNNPVRKGLVITPDDWQYQGVLHDLDWHD
jgi:REP element-mobilizing transposase RayT